MAKRGPAGKFRRWRRKGLLLALLVALVFSFGVPAWILFPPQEMVVPADVVMVIAGESDGRHQLGAELVEVGMAPNFVVSNPSGTRDRVGSAHCRGARRPEAATATWCLQPEPVTTTGEALTIGRLAEKESWSSATVVTSRLHARRVHTMLRQCTDLDVTVVYVDYIDQDIVVHQVLHEIGGYIKFWATNPC